MDSIPSLDKGQTSQGATKRTRRKRGDFTTQETIVLLRDLYKFSENRVRSRLVKRVLTAARALGATFEDKWAIACLDSFTASHHEVRRTSRHGTNHLLNTQGLSATLSTGLNAPDSEHLTHRSDSSYRIGDEVNASDEENLTAPDFKHDSHRPTEPLSAPENSTGYPDVNLLLRYVISSISDVENGDKVDNSVNAPDLTLLPHQNEPCGELNPKPKPGPIELRQKALADGARIRRELSHGNRIPS